MRACPVCGETRQDYLFIRFGRSHSRCSGCGLISVGEPQEKTGSFSVKPENFLAGREAQRPTDRALEKETVEFYLNILKAHGLAVGARALLIGEPGGDFWPGEGFAGLTLDQVSDMESRKAITPDNPYDAVVIINQLEKTPHPDAFLAQVHRLLKPAGWLLLALPSLDSPGARMFGSAWTEWRPDNRVYFAEATIQFLLWKSRFNQVEVRSDDRTPTVAHIHQRAESLPQTWLTRTVRAIYPAFPKPLRGWRLPLPSSGMIVLGRCADAAQTETCSFIVPAYNEARTFPALMDSLLEKRLPDAVRKEIIIIESNSSDGTREQAAGYEKHAEVQVVYQERPRGKGHAVREGFQYASGDIVVIQDADLEYDLNDLDELLAPLLKYRAAFVLGSRHGGQWKMRQFANQKGMSTFFNFGHQLFTALLNLMYGQRLKDPFTMYKVFRRDCLHRLRLEANRFDFDFELVIKLIRKGYRPLEIPVNYRSRSFGEGKKVRVVRDPLTWMWALIKYRFAPIYETDERYPSA